MERNRTIFTYNHLSRNTLWTLQKIVENLNLIPTTNMLPSSRKCSDISLQKNREKEDGLNF